MWTVISVLCGLAGTFRGHLTAGLNEAPWGCDQAKHADGPLLEDVPETAPSWPIRSGRPTTSVRLRRGRRSDRSKGGDGARRTAAARCSSRWRTCLAATE